jgi:ABC-type multidrug transport system fused ATPase/permease subunit
MSMLVQGKRVNTMRWLLGRLGKYFRASVYVRLFPYIRPYKWSMAVVVSLLVLQVGVSLVEPWSLQILVSYGLEARPMPHWLSQAAPFLTPDNRYGIVVFAVVLGIVLHLASKVLDLLGDYLKGRVNASITLNFQADLFNHLQRLSFSYHDQTTVGDSLYRLNNETGFVSTLLWSNFRHLLQSGLTLVGMLCIVFWYDWVLAVLALASAPVLYGAVWYYGKHFKAKSKRVKVMESDVQTILEEVLSCLRVVKAFGQEDREQRRFEEQSWKALLARMRLSLQQSLFWSTLGFVTKLNRSLILLFGAFHVISGHLELGVLLVITAYVSQIHVPLEEIGQTLTDMQLSMASAERVLEVMDIEPEIQDRPGAKALSTVGGAVTLKDVSFGYRPERPVLHHVSLSVHPGEVIAVVGPTGAGKTTLANLIARFYDPQSGQVLLDGHDLRDLKVRTLRDHIALVIQEPILFSTSLRENISYGRQDATMEEIIAAAKAANAHDFITAFPNGYDTEVGERGVRLSGGERQRVAVARAFLKDAPVLILDEPTSSIDSRTELVIIDALDRLMVGRTTFIIAHRLSTIRRADQILVIDHGRIVEAGTHAQLLAQDGIYAQMFHIQSRGLRRDMEEVPA